MSCFTYTSCFPKQGLINDNIEEIVCYPSFLIFTSFNDIKLEFIIIIIIIIIIDPHFGLVAGVPGC
jgi:hypothetical protein